MTWRMAHDPAICRSPSASSAGVCARGLAMWHCRCRPSRLGRCCRRCRASWAARSRSSRRRIRISSCRRARCFSSTWISTIPTTPSPSITSPRSTSIAATARSRGGCGARFRPPSICGFCKTASLTLGSTGGSRTHKRSPRFELGRFAGLRTVPSGECPGWESNPQSLGFKPSRSARWRTRAHEFGDRVRGEGIEPSPADSKSAGLPLADPRSSRVGGS